MICAALLGGCRARGPTYHADVAPILAARCRDCHQRGGVAPVPTLDDYASARMYAQPIKVAVQTRRMPPWGADDTGLCGKWEGARWLSGDEIATIAAWQEHGAPEGDARPAPIPPRRESPFRADALLDTGVVYRPGLGAVGNRCFIADPALDRDRLLTAIRVVTTDARALSQVTLFALDSPAAETAARALDAADATPGYACFGTARAPDTRLLASWSWPEPVLRLPSGTGVRMRAGRAIVVQIHYDITTAGGAYQSRTRVELELDDRARELRVLPVAADGALAEAKRYVSVESSRSIDRPLRVFAVAPRMHIRGEVMQLQVERGAARQCLANFDHWHFYNGRLFNAVNPIDVKAGDRISISCAYETLGRTRPTLFGDDIDDEECIAYLFVGD